MIIASGETIPLVMANGIAETVFFKWLKAKNKDWFDSNWQSYSRYLFNGRLTTDVEIKADDTVDESKILPTPYAHAMFALIQKYRALYFDEKYLVPLRQNEVEKQHYLGLTLAPELDFLTQKSQDDIMATVIQYLMSVKMKDDNSGGEYTINVDRTFLHTINKLKVGNALPQPHNLINVVTIDMLMQTDTEIGNIEDVLLFIGLLFNGVKQDLLDIKTKLQAMATRILQGIWTVKDSIHELVHNRIKAEIDSMVANGKLSTTEVQEELRIINDINEIYKKIDTYTDLNDKTQMFWKTFFLEVALPVLRYDFRQIALTTNRVLLEAYYRGTGWTGTDAELQKVIDRQLEFNIRRK